MADSKLGTCDTSKYGLEHPHEKNDLCVNWREQPAQAPLTPYGEALEQRVSDFRSGYSSGYSDGKNGERMRDKDSASLFFNIGGVPDVSEYQLDQGEQPAQAEPKQTRGMDVEPPCLNHGPKVNDSPVYAKSGHFTGSEALVANSEPPHTCQELRPNDSVPYSDGPCLACAIEKADIERALHQGPPNSTCQCGRKGKKCPIHEAGPVEGMSAEQFWREWTKGRTLAAPFWQHRSATMTVCEFAEAYAALKVREAQSEPLYCDDCEKELQRESCNHVRECFHCIPPIRREIGELREERDELKRDAEVFATDADRYRTLGNVWAERALSAESALREARDSLVKPLKDACDRDWKDETPEQIVAIAANAIYWRGIAVEHANRRDHQYTDWCDGCNPPALKDKS